MNLFRSLSGLFLSRLRWLFAIGDERDAGILALGHQIFVLQRQVVRPKFTETDRTIRVILSRAFDRRRLAEVFPVLLATGLLGDPPPIRDPSLLGAAAARPRASAFGSDAYPDVWTKAAALLQSIVENGNH